MSDAGNFIKYIFKEAWKEVKGFLSEVVSLRPKTLVYICGTAFLIFWTLGKQKTAVFFLVGFLVALVYKHWIGGEWRREAKRQLIEKLSEKGVEYGKPESRPDQSSSSLPQNKIYGDDKNDR